MRLRLRVGGSGGVLDSFADEVFEVDGVRFLNCTPHELRLDKQITEKEGSKETLVESGIYGFVRHPEFLGHILIISALVIISQHWVSLVVGATLIALLCLAMIEEEKRNIKKFGSAYRDYMRRVPRVNLIAGIARRIRGKRG
ncbi:MAG: methyltransferase family protein [Candidatus Alkanophagales archaeon]